MDAVKIFNFLLISRGNAEIEDERTEKNNFQKRLNNFDNFKIGKKFFFEKLKRHFDNFNL